MDNKLAVTTLSALAQESRLAVFRLLVERGPGGLAAGRIAEELGIVPATLTFHLKELERRASWARGRRGGSSTTPRTSAR